MEDFAAKPYKGPESYQTHDAELFFGRSSAAEELTARVLSSRVTVLHAQSGAGKTSLINAMLIPGLELRGWMPFRVLPQNNPTLAVMSECLSALIPPIWAEEQAVSRALCALAPGPGEELSIDELVARYDDLPPSDPRRRHLISPVRAESRSREERIRSITASRWSSAISRPSRRWTRASSARSSCLERRTMTSR